MSVLDLKKIIENKIKEFGFFSDTIMWEEFMELENSEKLSEKCLMLHILESRYNDGKRYETAFTLNPVIKAENGYNTCYYLQDKLIATFNGTSGDNENIIVENFTFETTDIVARDKALQGWTCSVKINAIYRDKKSDEKIEYEKMGKIEINLKQEE